MEQRHSACCVPAAPRDRKNGKGAEWSPGLPTKRVCLEAEAKNHSTRNLRLSRKRSWNRLGYSRSTYLSGTPSNTTNVLQKCGESCKPIRRTRSASPQRGYGKAGRRD